MIKIDLNNVPTGRDFLYELIRPDAVVSLIFPSFRGKIGLIPVFSAYNFELAELFCTLSVVFNINRQELFCTGHAG